MEEGKQGATTNSGNMNISEEIIQSNRATSRFGWCKLEKAQEIVRIMDRVQPKISLEVGLYGGMSFIAFAIWHKHNGGKAIGIDPWTVDAACAGYDGQSNSWWQTEARLDDAKRSCYMAITNFGCSNCCEIHECKSEDYQIPEGLVIDVGHLDGNHSEPAIADVRKFAPLVRAGGVLILDDIGWMNSDRCHVAEAAALLPSMGFVELSKLDTGAVFERREIR